MRAIRLPLILLLAVVGEDCFRPRAFADRTTLAWNNSFFDKRM